MSGCGYVVEVRHEGRSLWLVCTRGPHTDPHHHYAVTYNEDTGVLAESHP